MNISTFKGFMNKKWIKNYEENSKTKLTPSESSPMKSLEEENRMHWHNRFKSLIHQKSSQELIQNLHSLLRNSILLYNAQDSISINQQCKWVRSPIQVPAIIPTTNLIKTMNYQGTKAELPISLGSSKGNQITKGDFPQNSIINYTAFHMPPTTSTLPVKYQMKGNTQTCQTVARYRLTIHTETTCLTNSKDF